MASKYTVLSVTTLGALMTALDSTIVYLAIPAMARYFSTGIGYLTLMLVSYLVTSTSTMVPSGSLAARIGKKKIYLAGFATFTVSSFLIAESPNVLMAIIFRAIQGTGAGIMGTIGIPVLLSSFPSKEHGRAIGINSIAWSIGALAGPVVGGYLVSIDWRYIFLINIPIGAVAIALGLKNIPADHGDISAKVNVINVLGFLLFIIPLTAGISLVNYSWLSAAAIFSPIFIATQKRDPLIPAELLRNKGYSLLLAATSLQALSFFAVSYAMSIYLQAGADFSSITAGLVLAANPIASLVMSPIGGYLYDRTKKGAMIMLAGLLTQGSCVLALSFALVNPSPPIIFTIFFISGMGGTLFWTASTVLAVNAGEGRNRSIASGTLFMLRNIALIIGLSSFPIFLAQNANGLSVLLNHYGREEILNPVRYYFVTIAFLSYLSAIMVILYSIINSRQKSK